jgi:outer membrane protein
MENCIRPKRKKTQIPQELLARFARKPTLSPFTKGDECLFKLLNQQSEIRNQKYVVGRMQFAPAYSLFLVLVPVPYFLNSAWANLSIETSVFCCYTLYSTKQKEANMAIKKENATANPAAKKYAKIGIIAAAVVAVAALGVWGVSAMRTNMSVERSLSGISGDAATGADLRIAVIRMDAIQAEAKALQNLREQKESYESKLRDELTKEQKTLEKEKAEIEKSQDVLSREALQRRVAEYQNRVAKLQRALTERAQSIEAAFQKALNEIQIKHLDPLIEGIVAKKNLSLVIDGRFARIGEKAANLDITEDVIQALDKKISSIKMDAPKGF